MITELTITLADESRKTIEQLVGLLAPLSARVAVIEKPNPGDVVVIDVPLRLARDARAKLYESLRTVWPDNEVVIIDGCGTLRVDRKGEA